MAYTRAVIDLGTNTFQLLVGSSMDVHAPLEVLVNLQRPVQLGKGAMEGGVIQADALHRAQVVLAEFVEIAALHGCEVNEITALATSILRNASNGVDVMMEWQRSLGIHVELISGLREAELIFEGVFQSLPQPWERPTLLMDIGGGSVEFILFQGAEVHFKTSLELGGLKLRSLFNHTDFFDLRIKEDCIAYIDRNLQPLFEACGHIPNVLIGAAGAFETMWDIEQALNGGGTVKKQAYELDIPCFYQVKGAIERMEPGERTHFPGMREFRAGIFPYANLLVDRILTQFDIQDMWMSTNSLKEGFWYSQRDEAIKKGIIF
jgi:exopolyphosphatase/guanosine-5'-triphosphate,3'-diphosphate pyrophosphatase